MKRRTMSEGLRLVREYDESGEGRGRFCERRGLGVATLDYWRRQVAAAGTGELVEVEVKSPCEGASQGMLRIGWPNGVRVEMEAGVAELGLLRRMHEILGGGATCSH